MVLSNFEKGFEMYLLAMDEKQGKARTRHINESICLMASDDYLLMKKIVINNWMMERALNSSYANKYKIQL